VRKIWQIGKTTLRATNSPFYYNSIFVCFVEKKLAGSFKRKY